MIAKPSAREETLNQKQSLLIGLMSIFVAILFLAAAPVWAVPQDHDEPDPCEDCDPPEDDCPCEDGGTGASEIRYYTGTVIQDPIDFSIPAPGLDLEFRRFHSSREPSAINEDLGVGWRHPYNIRLKFESGDFEPMVILRPFPGGSNELRYYENGDGTFGCVTPGYTSTIAQDSATGDWIERFSSGNKYIYTSAGWLSAQEDRNGNRLTVSRQANGEIDYMEDAVGRRLTFTYSGGRITKITDPINRTVEFGYDGDGNLVTAKDRGGFTMTYTYDADRRITSKTRSGRTWTYSFANGRISALTDPTGATQRFIYAPANRTTFRIDANGETWTTVFNSFGQWEKSVNPLGGVSLREYDASRSLIREVDPAGHVTSFLYDTMGQIRQRTDPTGAIWTFSRNSLGKITTETTPVGASYRYEYDADGNRIRRFDPSGNVISDSYNALGQVVSHSDELGRTSTITYDTAGYRSSVTDAAGFVMTIGYDFVGRNTSFTNANGEKVEIAYDALDRPTQIKLANGATFENTWDAWDRISSKDPQGIVSSFEYDKLSRLIRATDHAGVSISITYDSGGKRTGITDGKGNTTTFEYDKLGRMTRTIYPTVSVGTPEEQFSYDSSGNLTGRRKPTGEWIYMDHDSSGRLTKISYPNSTSVVLEYDSAGRRISMTDQAGLTQWVYDSASRVISATDVHGRKITYGYDAAGFLKSTTDPESFTTQYNYDSRGLAATLVHSGETVSNTFDSAGRIVTQILPNGTRTNIQYDTGGYIVIWGNFTSDGDTISSFRYDLDASGNRVRRTEHSGIRDEWGYNARYELAREARYDSSGDTIFAFAYEYDSSGNRTSKTNLVTGESTAYIYGNDNRLITAGAAMFAHDLNGNMISRSLSGNAISYTWDYENRMLSAFDSSAMVSYEYDGLGQRIAATDNGNRTQFLWSGRNIINEYDSAGSPAARYFQGRGIDDFYAVYLPGQSGYYHRDALGSITEITDSAQTVQNQYRYEAFGDFADTPMENIPNILTFTGLRREQTALSPLVFARARMYDPTSGRWTAWDPIRHKGGGNLFEYVDNRPTTFRDPSGEVILVEFAIVLAVSAVTLAEAACIWDAVSSASNYSGARGSNSGGNHMRHCTLACEMTDCAPDWLVDGILTAYENATNNDPGDHAGNQAGLGAAGSGGDCECECHKDNPYKDDCSYEPPC